MIEGLSPYSNEEYRLPKVVKFIIASLVILIFIIATLDDDIDKEESFSLEKNANLAMSSLELELIGSLTTNEKKSLKPLYYEILSKRLEFSEGAVSREKPDFKDTPFCDVIDTFEATTSLLNGKCKGAERCLSRMPNEKWRAVYGISLIEQCNGKPNVKADNHSEGLDRAQKHDLDSITTIIDGKRYISPEYYPKVRESIKDCERARMTFMSLTADTPFLTVEMYSEINKALLRCEAFKTELVIQKPNHSK
ncbi:hypothetical protein [Vibrio sp. D431a]|uniref:hypothetical protein n=1 Tax=Vibrio sp. D431a TaxID=2837388 RepID=UPI0025561E81|nr:hypothetical protein [Vibrio sp. D431a]MDK9789942.1 hypothetical protein [Vibrio sp. D431a]